MAREIPSVGDLRGRSEITDAEIEAATEAYMKDEGAPPFVFSSGHRIDVGRAIDMHSQAKKLLAEETTAPGLRRTMVKTAVIMGFPVEGRESHAYPIRVAPRLTLDSARLHVGQRSRLVGDPARR